jgi:5-methylcytosine-specific restriction endonuclease McrA
MIVNREDILKARSIKGGFSLAQVKLAQSEFGKQWLKGMTGQSVTAEFWAKFTGLKTRKEALAAAKKTKKIINAVSGDSGGWEWKPQKSDIPAPVFNKKSKAKGKKKIISRKDNEDFYSSREWLSLRVRVLEKYECKCMMCGRSPLIHNVVIHVDHIKPRSKYPDLSLEISNLQLLCDACNIGKGNKYETDWRPASNNFEQAEIDIVFAAKERI